MSETVHAERRRDAIDERIEAHVRANLERYVASLVELCASPSISAEDRALPETAALVARVMGDFGIEARVMPTPGAPAVVAALPGRSSRRLLVYNHYDVQPVDPLDEWVDPPFEPTRRDGRLVARGVADDKGDLIVRLAAVEALRAVDPELPLPITFLVEGQEEIDGPAIGEFIRDQAELLACDVAFGEAGSLTPSGRPEIVLGVKGMLYVEIEARGPDAGPVIDAHSSVAPVVENPAWVLVRALASLRDVDGRVRIAGFYDRVRPFDDVDRAALASLPGDVERELRASFGVSRFLDGVSGAALAERLYGAPTCTIAGLRSGYAGPGIKTVLPSVATAKIDFRLVPDQRPEEILELLRRHLADEGFDNVVVRALTTTVVPARTPPDDPLVLRVVEITRDWYGIEPVVVPMSPGGQIFEPFLSVLGAPTMFGGVRPSGGNAHAPNEFIEIDSLVPAICFTAHLFRQLAE